MKAYGPLHSLTYDFATVLCGFARAPRRLAQEFNTLSGQGPLSIVDFGAGTGRLTSELLALRDDLSITGLEPSAEMRGLYDKKFMNYPDVTSCDGGYDNGLPLVDNEFDAILAGGVMDHFQIDSVLMREFLRVVKPGGYVGYTYERHEGGPAMRTYPGEGRTFYSFRDDRVREAIEEAGGEVALQKPGPGYFVNQGHFRPRLVDCMIAFARKP